MSASPSKEKLDREVKWAEKKRKAKPSLADYRKDLPAGSVQVKEDANGMCDGQVVGKDAVRRLYEMNAEWRRLEVEHGAENSADIPSERLRGDRGETVLPAATARRAALRRGLKPVTKWGRGRVYRVNAAGEFELIADNRPKALR